MQATIERATPRATPRRARRDNDGELDTSAYKAPLATFLVLVASARASAFAGAAGVPCEAAASPGVGD